MRLPLIALPLIDGHYLFENNRYVDGFLMKTVPLTSLMTDSVKPTLDEITMFEGSVDLAAATEGDSDVSLGLGLRLFGI